MPRHQPATPVTSLLRRQHLWPLLVLLVAAILVFRGALGYFFSQDDFAGLARAGGILPRLAGPWRYLSGQAYFDVMRAIAGLHPLAYHLASLIAHLSCTALLFALLRRHAATPAAWLGAGFFAVHPALYTALYSVSGIGEILAALFGLAALLAVGRAGRWRWSAAPLFALSLLSKESTILLPLLAAAPAFHRPSDAARARAGVRDRLRDPLVLTLFAIAAIYAATFLLADTFGIRRALSQKEAYALAFDASLGRNLLTYLGWTVNFLLPTVRSFADTVDPKVYSYGIAALALWLAGCAWKPLRERGWLAGGALYLALLLPVLPLRNHTYHYYLYGPLCGAAWCLAAAADVVFARLTAAPRTASPARARGTRAARGSAARRPAARGARTAVPWLLAAAAVAALAYNGAQLVNKIEIFPFVVPELRADPTVDRARIARNVFDDLRAAELPADVRLLFWSPGSIAWQRTSKRDTTRESYWETNVRSALMDGLAVRVLFPQVREVEFVRTFRPFDNFERYALYRLDGHLRIMTDAEADSLLPAPPGP